MRPPDVARLALGIGAVSRPGLPVRVSGATDGSGVRRVVQVLGARYVVQALGGQWLHRSWVPTADAAVDLVHAASMVGVARILPQHRRLALLSAAAAVAFAGADLTERVR
jgi:hypothetical protein